MDRHGVEQPGFHDTFDGLDRTLVRWHRDPTATPDSAAPPTCPPTHRLSHFAYEEGKPLAWHGIQPVQLR